MARLGVVGTLVWDRIRNPFAREWTGTPREQWGGAAYSLASLAATCPPGWQVEPILKVGRDLEGEAMRLLRALPHVVPGPGVRVVPEANNRVELHYLDPARRDEVQTGGVPPWSWAELEPLLGSVDALYLNFLSGLELDLSTAQRLRQAFRGPIYADLHSLFLTPPEVRPRRPRPLPRAAEWLACFDAVQLNEVEAGLLAEALGEPAAPLIPSLPRYGPGLVLVTLGERGVRFVRRAGLPDDPLQWPEAMPQAGTETELIPPPSGPVAGDPTGCGDVWGAACFMGLLGGLPLRGAIARAEHLAAVKIVHSSTRDLHLRFAAALRG